MGYLKNVNTKEVSALREYRSTFMRSQRLSTAETVESSSRPGYYST